jgi:hypothetical protein
MGLSMSLFLQNGLNTGEYRTDRLLFQVWRWRDRVLRDDEGTILMLQLSTVNLDQPSLGVRGRGCGRPLAERLERPTRIVFDSFIRWIP